MSKSQQRLIDPLEFKEFWTYIGRELGNSRLRINPKAKDIHNFIDPSNDAKEYLKHAIKESYKRSDCTNLRSKINVNLILDILGETAYKLRSNHRDDLFDIELLEEIAWHISDRYQHCLVIKKISESCGQIVSFPDHRIRIANSRL